MTCLSLGIILSVTKREDEIAADLKDLQDREAALQRIIDREVSVMNTENTSEAISEEEQKVNNMKYSIRESLKQENELDNQGDSLINGQNPMNAVLNKK
jgi:cell division protein FtsW